MTNAILVVCFILAIGIMKILPQEIKNFLADIMKAGMSTGGGTQKMPNEMPNKITNIFSNILAFLVIYVLLFFGAEYLFKNVLKLGNLE